MLAFGYPYQPAYPDYVDAAPRRIVAFHDPKQQQHLPIDSSSAYLHAYAPDVPAYSAEFVDYAYPMYGAPPTRQVSRTQEVPGTAHFGDSLFSDSYFAASAI